MKTRILSLSVFLFLCVFLSISFVSALAIVTVSVSPKEIAPGETARISLTLENNLEEDVTDVSVSLNLDTVPFAPSDTSNEITIDELRSDKNRILNFEIVALTNAESGIYKVPIEISYVDEDGDKNERSSLISLTVNSEPVLDIEVEDGLLLKGQNNVAVIRIINKGLSDIKFLEAEIGSSTRYSLLSSKKTYLGDVDSDDFETVEISIFFNENAPSTVTLPISLIYRDVTNKQYTEEFDVNMKVYSREQALQLGLIQKSYTVSIVIGIVVAIVLYLIYRKLKKRRQRKKAETAGK